MGASSSARISAAVALLAIASTAHAALVFNETFEGTLSAWTGKSGGAHAGRIVADPLNAANHVLSFSARDANGNIFSIASFADTTPTHQITLSFDYLGTCGHQDCGGFIGLSPGFPGTQYWLAGSMPSYGGLLAVLQDTGQWTHVSVTFTGTEAYHVMIEQYSLSAPAAAGTAYFDNIQVLASAVPEPPAIAMALAGLPLLLIIARTPQQQRARRYRNKLAGRASRLVGA